MTAVAQWIEARDSSGLKTGLTPTVTHFVKVSDLTDSGVQNVTVREIGNGVYEVSADITERHLIGVDFGASLSNPDDRYRNVIMSPNDESVTITQTPSGTYSIAIVTQEADTTRIPNVFVQVLNDSGQVIRTQYTDANGDLTVHLNAGNYTLRCVKAMVNFDDVSITVDANGTETVTGSIVTPTAPAAGVQTLTVIPVDPSLLLDAQSQVFAQVTSNNVAVAGSDGVVTSRRIYAVKKSTHFELSLAKGIAFRIVGVVGHDVWFDKTITVSQDDTRGINDYT